MDELTEQTEASGRRSRRRAAAKKSVVYPNAPIIEAILDIRVQHQSTPTLETLAKIGHVHADRFPTRHDQVNLTNAVVVGPGSGSFHSQQTVGYQFSAPDGKRLFRSQMGGFSYHLLAPYSSWSEFQKEAESVWKTYSDLSKPVGLARLALRYINRLDIPLPVRDIEDWLRVCPHADLPEGAEYQNFFLQLQVMQPDLECMCVINETITQLDRSDILPVILDIEIFRESNIPKRQASLWSLFSKMRTRKNEIFESAITDRSRELFYD